MGKNDEMKKKRSISRRTFLKTIPATTATCIFFASCSPDGSENNNSDDNPLLYGPREGVSNPYVNSSGEPILVCVRGTNFAEMMRAGMDSLGGLGRLVAGQNVLIKPNLNHSDPFPGITSPDTIITIVNELLVAASGDVFVGDKGWLGGVYAYLGLEPQVTAAGATLLNFNESYPVRRDSWDNSRPDFMVYQDVYNAPVIINTCCLKRHVQASMTCAIKCNVGCITGPAKSGTRYYIHNQSPNFLMEIAEVAGLVNPELNIVDARSILIHGGPMIENGKVVDGVNRIVICGDIIATDVYCAHIMEQYDDGFSISSIQKTLTHAESLGLGTADLNRVEIREIDT
jgi:uncharacterized protein (DUF362 family)